MKQNLWHDFKFKKEIKMKEIYFGKQEKMKCYSHMGY